jgi:hypothetical protein
MPLPPHAEQTLHDFEERLAVREKDVVRVKKEINSFLAMYDEPPRYEIEEAAQEQGRGKGVSLRNDEFANFTSTSAALRHLLEKRGKDRGAIPVDEAFRLLKTHSYPFDGRMNEDKQMSVLRIAIGKDRNLLKHPNDTVGMLAWYPGRKKTKKSGASEASGTRVVSDDEDSDDEGDEDDAEGGEGEAEASKPQLPLPAGSKGSD